MARKPVAPVIRIFGVGFGEDIVFLWSPCGIFLGRVSCVFSWRSVWGRGNSRNEV